MSNLQVSILSGVLIHLTIGSVYCWGLLKNQLASYYYLKDPSVSVADLYPGISAMNICHNAFQWITPILLHYLNHRIIIMAGCVVISVGVWASIMMEDMMVMMVIYCASIGIAAVLLQLPPLVAAWESHPESKGLITGIIIGAQGLSSMFFNQLIVQLLNPNEENPDFQHPGDHEKFFNKEIAEKVPATIQLIAYIFFGLAFLGCILCFRAPTDTSKNIMREASKKLLDHKEDSMMTQVSTQTFIIPFIVNALTLQTGLFVINNQQSVGISFGQSTSWLNMVGQIGALVNFCARIVFSLVTDAIGQKTSFCIIMMFQVINLLLLQIQNEQVQVLSCVACFFTQGGHFVQTAVQFSKLQNPVLSAKIYGFWFLSFTTANASNLLFKQIQDWQGWESTLLVNTIINVLGLVAIQFSKLSVPRGHSKNKQEGHRSLLYIDGADDSDEKLGGKQTNKK